MPWLTLIKKDPIQNFEQSFDQNSNSENLESNLQDKNKNSVVERDDFEPEIEPEYGEPIFSPFQSNILYLLFILGNQTKAINSN